MKREEFKRTLQDIATKAQSEKDELTAKLQGMETSAGAVLTNITNDKTEIDKIKESAGTKSTEIDKHLSDSKVSHDQLTELMGKVQHKETGIEANLASVTTQKDQADTLASEISAIKDDLLIKQKDASDKTVSIDEKYQNVLAIDKDSTRIKEDIEKTYKLATHLGLAGSTTTRKRELNKSVYIWLAIFLLLVAGVGAMIADASKHLGDAHLSNVLLSRSVLITPLLALAGLAFNQFRHERRLLEEYAFKAAMAQSLESFTNVLNREFNEKKYKDKILEFVTGAMSDIYDRSSLEKQPMIFTLGIKSKLAHIEAKISEIDDKSTRIEKKLDLEEEDIQSEDQEAVPAEKAKA